MVMFSGPSCEICGAFKTRKTALVFACAVCGRRMLEVIVGDPETIFHCPRHCTTLVPNNDMLDDARSRAERTA